MTVPAGVVHAVRNVGSGNAAELAMWWREFYLAVAGAGAVLLGLVFIALSLHLAKAEAPGAPVLGLGGPALINLIYVLLLSLGMVVPYRLPAWAWIAVLVVAVVGLSDSITTLRRARRNSEHLGPAAVRSHPGFE